MLVLVSDYLAMLVLNYFSVTVFVALYNLFLTFLVRKDGILNVSGCSHYEKLDSKQKLELTMV